MAYPAAIFQQTHQDRLAVIALLHGLTPPPIDSARVLEIGCGDGMNQIALAAAYPNAYFLGFDLADSAIERGRAIIAAAGLSNVELQTLDILEAHQHVEAGSFDYIMAHGVYAWVPDHVREATMTFMAHAMSPHGVGFVSYNALPGGHIRQVMRDMLVHELEGIIDPEQKLDATRTFLHAFKDAQADDDVVVSAIRAQAAAMLERPGNVLFHDELGDYFAPQSLSATIAEAEKNGLRYLSDGGRNRHLDGFMADEFAAFEDPEKLIVRQSQRDDYLSMRFFRQTLFVRKDKKPLRTLDPFRASPMWISTTMKRGEGREFRHGADVIELRDDGFADAIETISSGYPNRFPVSEHVQGDGPLTALLHMFSQWYANFHTTAPPFCLTVGNRPCTSPLVRGQIFMGFQTVCALNHQLLNIDQENIRALLVAADGTRTVSELENMDEIDIPADQVRDALQAAAMKSLMVA